MRLLLTIATVLLASCTFQNEPPLVELSKNISQKMAVAEGSFAVAFADLKTGDTLFINADERFHAASTMKTPVMIELYKQAESGLFSLDDYIPMKNEFASIVDGSPFQVTVTDQSEAVLYDKIGSMMPIRDLMFEMITQSSNLATNILIDLVEARKVTATMHELGALHIEVLRGVEDSKAFEKGLNNTTSANDLMKIFAALGKDEIISEQACQEMIEVLSAQKFNDIIPAKLPQGVTVAHKTGSINGVQHDSGLIVLPNGHEYVLILLSKDLPSREAGVELLSEISKMVYDYVISDKHQLR